MKSVFWTILRIQCVIIYKEQTKKMRCISERNKWFYAECDWSILPVYFSSYQQRRVFLSSGWFVTKVSFYVTGHVSQGSETKRPPSSRWVCPYFVSQQTELIQSETPPTSITDLICKGTWSINEDVLFERCCFPHFFIIIILLIYLFSGIKNPFLLLIRVYILAQTVGIPNAIKDFLGDKKKAFAVKKEIKSK